MTKAQTEILQQHFKCSKCGKLKGKHRGHDGRCPSGKPAYSRMPNHIIWHVDESMKFDPSGIIQMTPDQKKRKITNEQAIQETIELIKKLKGMI
jgi:hypothetical protein